MTSCLKEVDGQTRCARHTTQTMQHSTAGCTGAVVCRTTRTVRALREGNAGLRPGLDRQGVLVLAARNGWWANRPCGPQEIQGAELSGLRQLQVHLRAPSPEV
jgi:hypothetical protein